ncbi:hypothetical protein A9P79_27955 (plasmid) [Cupriavidus taiwanensis]|nr:hypothetical protein A9P79_27955 [Cupriavidus taiwanensis]
MAYRVLYIAQRMMLLLWTSTYLFPVTALVHRLAIKQQRLPHRRCNNFHKLKIVSKGARSVSILTKCDQHPERTALMPDRSSQESDMITVQFISSSEAVREKMFVVNLRDNDRRIT